MTNDISLSVKLNGVDELKKLTEQLDSQLSQVSDTIGKINELKLELEI
ncbi:diguanylate cyclase, GAF, HAMP domains protein [Weissella oryzae SG25]|uniref:Diguanylate cyclase, GAF, HAMP domains protein n=1 Tax=Weissella oryzae (strain DSM 25784 / JCM 18191 / LMG 30913 / SG25) TaxID=1329250 RepID=A0A069CRL1_WEIOS|nr:hypothetical protein [Weissella oryzae]GAK30400.1 diguanylate cyclase, GAF, HAMP domains protein [Weissella oryzae SG25]